LQLHSDENELELHAIITEIKGTEKLCESGFKELNKKCIFNNNQER
jgi:hypothetical protein